MYATTFPCHECARHIVVVGISEVYFIDPYPRSRVLEMFEDSIVVDREANGKIPFRAFTGIAPRAGSRSPRCRGPGAVSRVLGVTVAAPPRQACAPERPGQVSGVATSSTV